MIKTDSDIIAIGEGLRDLTLPKTDWTHAAHVAAAVWLVCENGVKAEQLMPDMIRTYNEATGVENTDRSGYHHTITIASLRRIACMGCDGSLAEIFDRAMASGLDDPNWLFEHYSPDRLFSVEARRGWVNPDRRSLP